MDNQTFSFDQLPQQMQRVTLQLEKIERLLLDRSGQVQQQEQDIIMDVQDTAKFLHLSVPTIYSKASRGELPAMKRGKRLYFSRQSLMQYLRDGECRTMADIEAEANAYLSNRKKG
jgi:excisionase family DNA binding protein